MSVTIPVEVEIGVKAAAIVDVLEFPLASGSGSGPEIELDVDMIENLPTVLVHYGTTEIFLPMTRRCWRHIAEKMLELVPAE